MYKNQILKVEKYCIEEEKNTNMYNNRPAELIIIYMKRIYCAESNDKDNNKTNTPSRGFKKIKIC